MKQLKILIVEPDCDARDAFAELLKQLGFSVETAIDGRDALAVATSNPPDAIFTELLLNDGCGRDLCAQLRKLPQGAKCFIVALTACCRKDEIEKALDPCFDLLMLKPAKLSHLLAVLKPLEQAKNSEALL